MKRITATVLGVIIMATTAHAQQPNTEGRRFSPDQVRSVAPALEHYTQDRLYGDVWKRPGLTRAIAASSRSRRSSRAAKPVRSPTMPIRRLRTA